MHLLFYSHVWRWSGAGRGPQPRFAPGLPPVGTAAPVYPRFVVQRGGVVGRWHISCVLSAIVIICKNDDTFLIDRTGRIFEFRPWRDAIPSTVFADSRPPALYIQFYCGKEHNNSLLSHTHSTTHATGYLASRAGTRRCPA